MEYTVNDFFCGAGGVALGLRNAGFNIIWACDFDKHCVKTYKHNVGDFVVNADVTKLHYDDIPKADGWTFGFPCQDLSVAGKQAGFVFRCNDCGEEWKHESEDKKPICPKCGGTNFSAVTRSACFFEIMRLLDQRKPQEEVTDLSDIATEEKETIIENAEKLAAREADKTAATETAIKTDDEPSPKTNGLEFFSNEELLEELNRRMAAHA